MAINHTIIGSTPWMPRAQYKSVQASEGIDPATFSIRCNHLAYAATQGMKIAQSMNTFSALGEFITDLSSFRNILFW